MGIDVRQFLQMTNDASLKLESITIHYNFSYKLGDRP
jgi:hypothetical protein